MHPTSATSILWGRLTPFGSQRPRASPQALSHLGAGRCRAAITSLGARTRVSAGAPTYA